MTLLAIAGLLTLGALGAQSPSDRIEDCRILYSKSAERHPVAKLTHVAGLRFEGALDDELAVQAYCDKLLAANSDLLAGGARGGTLRFDGLVHVDYLTSARYEQQGRTVSGQSLPVHGALVRVFFDESGRLTQVANVRYEGVDGLPDPTRTSEQAEGVLRGLIAGGWVAYLGEFLPADALVGMRGAEILVTEDGPRVTWRARVIPPAPNSERWSVWMDDASGEVLRVAGSLVHAAAPQKGLGAPSQQSQLPGGTQREGSLHPSGVTGPQLFFSPGDDPSGSDAFIAAAGTVYTDDLDTMGNSLGQIPIGPVMNTCTIIGTFGGTFGAPLNEWAWKGSGVVSGYALTQGYNTIMTIAPDEPLSAWGGWLYDDQGDRRFQVTLTFTNGSQWVSPEMDDGSLVADSVFGFVGVTSPKGIQSIEIKQVTPFLTGSWFCLDQVCVATVAPHGPPAYDAVGCVEAFDPYPSIPPPPGYVPPPGSGEFLAVAPELDANFNSLYGRYVRVRGGFLPEDAADPNWQFKYLGAAGWEYFHALEGTAYYTLDRFRVYSFLFNQILTPQIAVYAGLGQSPFTNAIARYDPDYNVIELYGGGPPATALDGDVVVHEYTHALQDAANGLENPFPSAAYGPCLESPALSEGTADYAGDSLFNDPLGGEWYALQGGGTGRFGDTHMTVANKTCSGGCCGGAHDNGSIWESALWDLRRRVGKGIADHLALSMWLYMDPTDDFNSALETCVLQIDQDAFGGLYEDVVRRCFSIRKIDGVAAPYYWPAPFISSERPYADDVDETQSHTIPGASALRVTFDAYTRMVDDPDGTPIDLLHVMDGAGVDIPGSPFSGRDLLNETVTVPGDTVQLRLVSVPADVRVSAGYRVINIVAEDLSNLPPVADLQVSTVSGTNPLLLTFDVSGSADPDGQLVAYRLEPGDGSPNIDLDPGFLQVVHVYNRDGTGPILTPTTFTATLTVTDDAGDQDSTTVQVLVDP